MPLPAGTQIAIWDPVKGDVASFGVAMSSQVPAGLEIAVWNARFGKLKRDGVTPENLFTLGPGEQVALWNIRTGTLADFGAAPLDVFNPNGIANLDAWYRGQSLLDDGLVDGQQVATWRDESPAARNATQATAALRPIFKTGIINNHPVVRWDGVDDQLTAITGLVAQPLTWFVVSTCRLVTPLVKQAIFSGGAGVHIAQYAQNLAFWNLYAGTVEENVGAPVVGTFEVLAWLTDGASSVVTLNRVSQTPTVGTNGATNIHLGHDQFGATNLNGDIAELLRYNRALSASERREVENYLMAKYAL